MQILVKSDESIENSQGLIQHVENTVQASLERFSQDITRVEVHLSDQNGARKGENDKRCLMEARVSGRPPFAVSHDADSVHQAIDGAVDKLERSLESLMGKREDARRVAPSLEVEVED